MLLLIQIRDFGYVSGSIFGAASLIPQQQFLDILMIGSGLLGNRKRIYRFFQSFTGYKPVHSSFSILHPYPVCTPRMKLFVRRCIHV